MKYKKGDLVCVLENFWENNNHIGYIYVPMRMKRTANKEYTVVTAHRNGNVTLSSGYRYKNEWVQKANNKDYEFRKLLMAT